MNFRDINRDPVRDDLRGRMMASPEGRQLAVDGALVVALEDEDPATTIAIPADGRVVMYNRAGTLELWGSTRATGWQQL